MVIVVDHDLLYLFDHILAHESLRWNTPMKVGLGTTTDMTETDRSQSELCYC